MSTLLLEKLISQAEAARLRGCTRQAILRLIQKGRFTTVTIGGRVFLNRDEVLRYEALPGGRPVGKGTKERGQKKRPTKKRSGQNF